MGNAPGRFRGPWGLAFDKEGRVLLIRRGNEPFSGAYALPGGFIDPGEKAEDACRRELLEETGLEAGKLELLGVYSEPGRDPRGPVVSVAYVTDEIAGELRGGDDAADAEWVIDWRDRELAFDHAQIVADAFERAGVSKQSG